jgi:hypothetical protein
MVLFRATTFQQVPSMSGLQKHEVFILTGSPLQIDPKRSKLHRTKNAEVAAAEGLYDP